LSIPEEEETEKKKMVSKVTMKKKLSLGYAI